MNTLQGKKAEDFVTWLNQARYVLPKGTSITEAKELFEKKLAEDVKRHEQKSR